MTPETSLSTVLDAETLKGILDDDSTLRKAIKGDTTAAVKVWCTIADKTADVGRVLVWAQHVAANIKRNVIDAPKVAQDPNARARAALVSIGIRGRVDDHVAIRELFSALEGFENLDNPNEEETHKYWVRLCRSHGLLDGLNDDQAYTLIRDIRQGRR